MNWPEHRLGRVARLRVSNVDKLSRDDETPVRLCNYVDVYKNGAITNDLDFMRATATPAQIANFRLTVGDTVFTKDSETAEDIGVPAYVAESSNDLICGYHLAIATPDQTMVDPRFLYWVMSSAGLRDQWTVLAAGVTRVGLRSDDVGKAAVPVPPLDEQRRIADFLDTETRRMDLLGALRKRQTTTVVDRIQRALDDLFINPGFAQTRLKYLLKRRMSYGVLVPRFVDEGGARLIRVNDLLDLPGRAEQLSQIDRRQSTEYARTVVAEGDLLVSVVGTVGRSALVPPAAAGSNVARAVARLQPAHAVGPMLLWLWTQSADFMRQVDLATGGDTAQPTLNVGDLGNFAIALPVMRSSLDSLTTKAAFAVKARDEFLAASSRQASLVTMRRQALITAAVTGQFDVATASGITS